VKLLLWLLLLPLTLIFVAFAVANRHAVVISLDPTPLSIEAPLYGLIFAGIFVGLIAGGVIAWIRAGRVRGQLRETQRNLRRLEADVEKAQKTSAVSPAIAATGDAAEVVKAA
jgi:uncharacterized integral membrane protein